MEFGLPDCVKEGKKHSMDNMHIYTIPNRGEKDYEMSGIKTLITYVSVYYNVFYDAFSYLEKAVCVLRVKRKRMTRETESVLRMKRKRITRETEKSGKMRINM